MLQSSMSPVLMAVITTNILLILLTLFLCNARLMVRMDYRLLALFAGFVLLRFLLPLEFPFTRNIHLPGSVSWLMATFYSGQLFMLGGKTVTPRMVFQWIWAIGIACGLLGYILSYFKARRYITLHGKVITHREPYADLLERVCREQGRKNRFTILEMPGLRAPVLFGIFSPRILIPENFDLTEKNIYYILRHETSHHFHRDLLLKNIVRLITLAYWWDPFCILLNRQTDVILEMRIDDALTMDDVDATREYLQCLISVAEEASSRTPLPRCFTMALLPAGHGNSWRRFTMLTHNQEKRKWTANLALGLAAASIFFLSYTFILESYCRPTDEIALAPAVEENLIIPSAENSYVIDNGDGTYDIYCNDQYVTTIDSLEYYDEDIPVYTKEDRPD